MKEDLETTEITETALEYQLDGLIADGWIEGIHSRLRSGKEGTVYCCAAGPRARAAGHDHLVAKVYRDYEHRTFRNDAIYRESTGRGGSFGRFGGKPDRRMQKAVQKKSRAGREGQSDLPPFIGPFILRVRPVRIDRVVE